MWGCYHLMKAVKEEVIITGLQADTLYGSSRRMAIDCSKMTAANFADHRMNLLKDDNQEGLAQMRRLAAAFGKQLVAPYADAKVRRFLLNFSWDQLNKPWQKMPAVVGFRKEFDRVAIYRRNDNMQCGSGIRERLAILADDPGVNPRGWQKMGKLYAELGGIV